MTKFVFETKGGDITPDDLSDILETLIAGQIADGFTSGDANGCGWWSVEDVAEDED